MTVLVGCAIWTIGVVVFAVTAIPWLPLHSEPPRDVLNTVAQIDVGLLIALAVRRPVESYPDLTARIGASLSALSLALALATVSIDMGWVTQTAGRAAIAGTYGAVVYLLAGIVGADGDSAGNSGPDNTT
jgi:peptidoglycan/LPS O-acetylase OafA/YrhL